MSEAIVQKRGRPRKVVDVDPTPPTSKEVPQAKPSPKRKAVAKSATAVPKSNAGPVKAKAKASTPTANKVDLKVKTVSLRATKASNILAPKSKLLPNAVIESRILQELAELEGNKENKKFTESAKKTQTTTEDQEVETILPHSKETQTQIKLLGVEPTAKIETVVPHKTYTKPSKETQITIELSEVEPIPKIEPIPSLPVTTQPSQSPIQIPTHQASNMPNTPIPLLYAHNPNTSILQQAAYMSTKSKTSQTDTKPRTLPLKGFVSAAELNRFAVEELSSRRGPGSGAEYTRTAQLKAEAPVTQPGQVDPKKYRLFARRITSIIVAAPIVIVTSYYLYQRLFLGVEPKRFLQSPMLSARPPAPKEGGTTT
ncbi:hypothetical protein EJ08DRAFT_728807 [Tothia fuscella]|uniref:Uncharacterized protein n=1 Tax=Tothia fuscella TaxID=1048955 RepID=A0A9P4P5I2_9PEZI|nr:hypothetical protein EJ08DRAFT_728807 [Tothia fuscella]